MSALSSAGSDRPLIRVACAIAVLALSVPAAAQEAVGGRSDRTAEVNIGLPEGHPDVSATFGPGELVLDLPQGAQLPLDLGAVGDGLLLAVEAQPAPDGGIRLVLRLGGAAVDQLTIAGGELHLVLSQSARSIPGAPTAEGSYRIGTDDLLQISINGKPELTQRAVVGPSGTVVAPLVGEVRAGGLTTGQVADNLTDILARNYLVDPRVDVQVVEYRSKWVLVSGAVLAPGRIALRGQTDLKQVMADAGGMAEKAGREIVISRKDSATGEAERIVVDRDQFESGVVSVAVRNGDLITVPEAEFCHILGEVRLPSQIRIEPGLTLFRALSNAGGLTEWANRKEIQVLRSDGTVETFDLQKIQKGESQDPTIRGGDRIYVKRRFL